VSSNGSTIYNSCQKEKQSGIVDRSPHREVSVFHNPNQKKPVNPQQFPQQSKQYQKIAIS
jgi:hypothetical protein